MSTEVPPGVAPDAVPVTAPDAPEGASVEASPPAAAIGVDGRGVDGRGGDARGRRAEENVAAALEMLETYGAGVARSVGTLRSRLDDLTDTASDLMAQIREKELAHARTAQDLTTRLEMAEAKLKRILEFIE